MSTNNVMIIVFVIIALLLKLQKLKLRKQRQKHSEMIDTELRGRSLDNFTNGILVIDNINASGFDIINATKNSLTRVKWADIESFTLDNQNHLELIVNGNKTKIPFETFHYHSLINAVPANILNFDYSRAKMLYEALEPCEICGYISVFNKICCSCDSIPYQFSQASKKMNRIEYLRKMQFEHFIFFEPGQTFQRYFQEEDLPFKLNLNWKPYILESELMERNSEN